MGESAPAAGEDDCVSPRTNTEAQGTSLADELRDSTSSPDDQSDSPQEENSATESDTEDEDVNWEKLQQTENEEVKDQDDNDNVSHSIPIHDIPTSTWTCHAVNILSTYVLDICSNGNYYRSLQPCF